MVIGNRTSNEKGERLAPRTLIPPQGEGIFYNQNKQQATVVRVWVVQYGFAAIPAQ